jgi:hypothetical protein
MCFRRYLLACKSSHSLAFFDWRQNNTLEFTTKPQIFEAMESRILAIKAEKELK